MSLLDWIIDKIPTSGPIMGPPQFPLPPEIIRGDYRNKP